MSDLPLSADMAEALDFARRHNGRLVRFAGAYWSAPNVARTRGIPDEHVSARVVDALVRRGKLKYTQWRQALGGPEPIEVVLKEEHE